MDTDNGVAPDRTLWPAPLRGGARRSRSRSVRVRGLWHACVPTPRAIGMIHRKEVKVQT